MLAVATFALALSPSEVTAQPRIEDPVTDLADALPPEQEAQLTQKLTTFRSSSGVAVAVLVVPSTTPLSLEAYSMRVATTWREQLLGSTSAVVYVLAVRDRRHRLEVNDIARVRLSDARSREVLDAARPALRREDWSGAVRIVMDGVLTTLAPEAPSPPLEPVSSPDRLTPPDAPTVRAPLAPNTVAPSHPSSPSEGLCIGAFCILSVLLSIGLLVSLLATVLWRAGRTIVHGLSGGTTYGHHGVSQTHEHADLHHSSAWSPSGTHDHHAEASSSWWSSDTSSSSWSSSDTSSSGSGFSGGGASSDW
jgi:uncharacterized protein